MSVTFYGGVNEIGGNKLQVDFSNGSIFLDFGLSYKEEALFFEEFLQPRSNCKFHDLLKLDIMPKINGIYRQDAFCPSGFDGYAIKGKDLWSTSLKSYEESKAAGDKCPEAVFISHAHMDHCGYVPYLGDIPLVSSGTTKTLLDAISDIANLSGFDDELTCLKERKMAKLKSGFFPGAPKIDKEDPVDRKFQALIDKGVHTTANGIKITGYNVGHSIPGSMACLVEADNKQVLYTGDLRFHGRTSTNLGNDLADLKPDVMITEGTRIEETIPDDENRVQADLEESFSRCDGLAIVGFAWKDLERYETVLEAAKKNGRTPIFDPRLAYLVARLGGSVYNEGAKVFLERSNSMLFSPADYVRSKHKIGEIDVSDWDSKSDPKVVDTTHLDNGVSAVEIRQSPQSYVLHMDYFRFKNILDIEPPSGSIFIRAQCEPFNPRMELSEDRMIEWLRHFKINERNNNEPYQIHASGHASGRELQDMIDAIKPKKLIPIHTEKPGLFYNSAGEVIIPVKGQEITVD